MAAGAASRALRTGLARRSSSCLRSIQLSRPELLERQLFCCRDSARAAEEGSGPVGGAAGVEQHSAVSRVIVGKWSWFLEWLSDS